MNSYSLIIYNPDDMNGPIVLEDYLENGATSYTVAGGTMQAGVQYVATLSYYSNAVFLDGEPLASVAYQSTNNVYFTTVPEPSVMGLLVASAAGVLWWRRARRKAVC